MEDHFTEVAIDCKGQSTNLPYWLCLHYLPGFVVPQVSAFCFIHVCEGQKPIITG